MSLASASRSEVTKIFTTSGWWVIGIIFIAYLGMQVGTTAAMYGMAKSNPELGASIGLPALDGSTDLGASLYAMAGSAGYIFPLLFGTLMATTEFRNKLIVPTLLATPRRAVALLGKLNASVVIGIIYGVIGVAVAVGLGAGLLAMFGLSMGLDQQETWLVIGRAFLALVLWALIGVGVGSVLRNQVAAIVVVLVFTILIEPLLRALAGLVDWLPGITRWLPGSATEALIGKDSLEIAGMSTGLLPWWVGGLMLLGYALFFTLLGALTTWRRDVS